MRYWKLIHLFFLIFGKDQTPDISKIENKGLLAVKIGQMYAVRIDFLGTKKCEHLSKLFEKNGNYSTENIYKLLERKAHPDLLKRIRKIDKSPIAVASIGQVHKAKLENGEEIAIKCIKDDFEEEFQKDIHAFLHIAKVACFFYPKLKRVADPIGTIDTIRRTTIHELNLENEITGTNRLKNHLKKYSRDFPQLEKIRFSKIYQELSSKQVLVSRFCPGISLSESIKRKEVSYNTVLDIFFMQGFCIFVIGEFHGDFHPGNIFIDQDNIYLLDNANIEQNTTEFGKGIMNIQFYLAEERYELAAKELYKLSKRKISDKIYKKYKKSFCELYRNFGGKSVSEKSLTTQMMHTIKLAVHSGMDFGDAMFPVIKSFMYLDGIVAKSYPEAIILKDVVKFKEDFEKFIIK